MTTPLTSSLNASFKPPKTSAEWYMSLVQVKHQYSRQQYKDCANNCSFLLEQKPVCPFDRPPFIDHISSQHQIRSFHVTFLHFHAATCHELLAQPMQNFSPTKLANLYDAKHHFELALSGLRKVKPTKHNSMSSYPASDGSVSSPGPGMSLPRTPEKCPKIPVRVRVDSISDSHDAMVNDEQILNVSPSQWLASGSPKKDRSILRPETQIPKDKIDLPTVDPCFKVIVPIIRCHRLSMELVELIEHHISWIDSAIKDVVAAHQRRMDLLDMGDDMDEVVKMAERKKHIKARKAEGWRKERFNPTRTQELVKVALEEL